MKHLIAHRGNVSGREINNENMPDYINNALNLGYEVELDVWYFKNNFYLGHDEPTYQVQKSYLLNKHFWCHAKNIYALSEMLKIGAHCFFHDTDDVTLTSKGYIWTYPEKSLFENSICVINKELQPLINLELNCSGICTDYPSLIKGMLND